MGSIDRGKRYRLFPEIERLHRSPLEIGSSDELTPRQRFDRIVKILVTAITQHELAQLESADCADGVDAGAGQSRTPSYCSTPVAGAKPEEEVSNE